MSVICLKPPLAPCLPPSECPLSPRPALSVTWPSCRSTSSQRSYSLCFGHAGFPAVLELSRPGPYLGPLYLLFLCLECSCPKIHKTFLLNFPDVLSVSQQHLLWLSCLEAQPLSAMGTSSWAQHPWVLHIPYLHVLFSLPPLLGAGSTGQGLVSTLFSALSPAPLTAPDARWALNKDLLN